MQPQVVERELERAFRGADERGDCACDVLGALTAVGQRADVDQRAAVRCFALYSRFQPWYSASFSGESTTPSVGWFGTSGSAFFTPKRLASTAPSDLIFISPKPGSAAIRPRRSSPSRASRHNRDASPP